MDLLLDTHSFLWFVQDNPLLSLSAKEHLMNGRNRRLLSAASIWELAIKMSLPEHRSPIKLNCPLEEFLNVQMVKHDVTLLPIEPSHVNCVSMLPFKAKKEHNDPFDRLIIAQSMVLKIPVVSVDAHFSDYGVALIW